MMKYKVVEYFYSIIGEGEWAGTPAFFIRLAGCNLNCPFCDTKKEASQEVFADTLYSEALRYPARKVVITGGEPTIHDLKPLTSMFRKDFKIHLETNATIEPNSLDIDWVAASPKPGSEVNKRMLFYASEVKFLCGFEGWKEFMEELLPLCRGIRWLMPIARGLELDWDNVKMAVDYCLQNPTVKFCCQIHKVIGVR